MTRHALVRVESFRHTYTNLIKNSKNNSNNENNSNNNNNNNNNNNKINKINNNNGNVSLRIRWKRFRTTAIAANNQPTAVITIPFVQQRRQRQRQFRRRR